MFIKFNVVINILRINLLKLLANKNIKYIKVIKIYPGKIITDIVAKIGHNNKLSAKYAYYKFIKVNTTSKLKEIQIVIDTGLDK